VSAPSVRRLLSVKAGEVSQIGVLRIPVVNELARG
jgi:hypothetical protein